MARNLSFAPGEWYHCFSRGVDKRTIYLNRKDYQRFLMLLYACNDEFPMHISTLEHLSHGEAYETVFERKREKLLVDIGAYALMPNHYHILLKEREEGGITSFMRRLNTAHAMYFNAKYQRTGALFSGRFKAIHVATDPYLKRVVNYIHGNPAELFEKDFKSGMISERKLLEKRIKTYEFTSLCDYENGARPEAGILSISAIEECLETRPSFHGVQDDFNTFYTESLKQLWV